MIEAEPSTTQYRLLTTPMKHAILKNIVEKGQDDENLHFLLFPLYIPKAFRVVKEILNPFMGEGNIIPFCRCHSFRSG